MQRKKQSWAAVVVVAIFIGSVLGRFHLIAPNPVTFFALGVLATLSIVGIAFGVWSAKRIVKSGQRIGD